MSGGMSRAPRARRQVAEGDRARREHCQDLEGVVVTPATRVLNLLWPGASSYQLAEVLNVAPAHVRMWRTGARPLPTWVRELAATRAAAITDALNATPAGPGQQAGWRNLPGYLANRDKR